MLTTAGRPTGWTMPTPLGDDGGMDDHEWQITDAGRAWTGEEIRARLDLRPEKLEIIDGRLFFTDEERVQLLGLLLENVGAARAVRLGPPEVWRNAMARLEA